MSTTKTPVEPTPLVSEPILSDARIEQWSMVSWTSPDRQMTKRRNTSYEFGAKHARDFYEEDRAKLIAERDELVGALRRMRKPFKSLNKVWALDWGPVNGACHHADRILSKYK